MDRLAPTRAFGFFGFWLFDLSAPPGKKATSAGHLEQKIDTQGDLGERNFQWKDSSLKSWKNRSCPLRSSERCRRKHAHKKRLLCQIFGIIWQNA
ncbi:MAG: hypothetical protein JRG73_18885 [Deltaproteobacteria bacterium]|nr:hypothetical protein [Deltaproteobacteria bacterium]MBW2308993.1 hypothetical protein [Deltaproteobacteria bacterium]